MAQDHMNAQAAPRYDLSEEGSFSMYLPRGPFATFQKAVDEIPDSPQNPHWIAKKEDGERRMIAVFIPPGWTIVPIDGWDGLGQ